MSLKVVRPIETKSMCVKLMRSEIVERCDRTQMSFNHSHYVPILKAKAGEFWALHNLKKSTRALVTPVLELVRHDPKRHTFDSDLEKKIESLFESWGNAPLYFDVTHTVPKNTLPEAKSITAAFIQLRNHGMEAIPVTRLGYSPKFQEAVKKIVETDDAGLMVRLGAGDLAVKDNVRNTGPDMLDEPDSLRGL
jgi:hypothetical protein